MRLTIDLSDQDAAALDERARAADIPRERYAARIVERALHHEQIDDATELAAGIVSKARKSAYGLLAKYGPGPTEEEIDENRREMFRGFGELAP